MRNKTPGAEAVGPRGGALGPSRAFGLAAPLLLSCLGLLACRDGMAEAQPGRRGDKRQAEPGPSAGKVAAKAANPAGKAIADPPGRDPLSREPFVPTTERPVVIAAAGDIAGRANRHGDTAALLTTLNRRIPLDAILVLGDLVYPRGELHDFLAHYHPTWGQSDLRRLTRPVPGNHEYDQGRSRAEGYFDYWNGVGAPGGMAGDRDKGYYSFDIGAWHFVALNSSDGCRKIGCAPGSPMHSWLVADLAATKQRCVLAYWHHPRFQTGAYHGSSRAVAPLWNALVDAGAEIVLAGHEHNFQQLVRLDKDGRPDPRGIRSFIVGTGGASAYPAFDDSHHPRVAETRFARRAGVLLLTLAPEGFRWRFVGTTPDGQGEVLSEGRDTCQ